MSASVERYGDTCLVVLPSGAQVMLARPLALALARALITICTDDAHDLLRRLTTPADVFGDDE